MIRKIFCFGLGLVGLLYEKFDELACAGEERLIQRQNGQEVEIPVAVGQASKADSVEQSPQGHKVDDLTSINGIGPTFAKRLKAAGITTYEELAALTADQLREITHAADWQADPNDWILQAQAVA